MILSSLISAGIQAKSWFFPTATNEGNLFVKPAIVDRIFTYLSNDSTILTSFPLVCRQWRDVRTRSISRLKSDHRLKELLPQIAQNEHVGLLKWALTWVKNREHDSKVYEVAVCNQNLEILKLALQHNLKYKLDICNIAASTGKLKALKLLISWRVPSADICRYAAGGGQIVILEWATQQWFWSWWWKLDESCYFEAAKGGHVTAIAWLYANKVPWNPKILYEAAFYGSKEIIVWARENKVKGWGIWESDLCAAAAKGGHLDLIVWLKMQGYRFVDEAMLGAVHFGKYDFFINLFSEGPAWVDRSPVKKEAVRLGKIEIIRALLTLGIFDYSEIRELAVAFKNNELLQWVNYHDQQT